MPETGSHVPLLTPRFTRAFELAWRVHREQTRKGTGIPYLAHPLAVTALVLEAGGDEDCAVAALLHDAVEDSQDGEATRRWIRTGFGPAVAAIVTGCSDWVAVPGMPKQDWEPRKAAYLARLKVEEDWRVLLVSACDKVHNAEATLADLAASGPSVWDRFNAGRDRQLSYYGCLAAIFQERSGSVGRGEVLAPVARRLAAAVGRMREPA